MFTMTNEPQTASAQNGTTTEATCHFDENYLKGSVISIDTRLTNVQKATPIESKFHVVEMSRRILAFASVPDTSGLMSSNTCAAQRLIA
jgi:hypothetical protein